MLIDLTMGLLCALIGFVGTVWLLVIVFGDDMRDPVVPFVDDPVSAMDRATPDGPDPFIPMPDHLRTRDEMVDWLTKELPKLTAAVSQSGSSDGPR